MRISCVIVSYNNGDLLKDAIMSVLGQTHPPDEIVVADDASTDGSRELIYTLSRTYRKIRPILRDRNLGVSMNRDLAIREAAGNLITTLDGDDYFLPTKIEAEAKALERSSALIAYSDVKVIHYAKNAFRIERMPEFALLNTSNRVRWILGRRNHNPQDMLFARDLHEKIGGYNHDLRTYEDWDYKIRLAAYNCRWAHSQITGVVIRRHGEGLSGIAPREHMRDRYRVLRLNRELARKHVGSAPIATAAARILLSGLRWSVVVWYWEKKRQILRSIVRARGLPS